MATMNTYLNFPGNTEEVFIFYKSVFGGEFLTLQRFKDTPEAVKVAEKDKEKIIHISLPIGKGNLLMATDVLGSTGQKIDAGNNFYIFIEAENKEEAVKIFEGLSAGGKIIMPLADTFWGAYYGIIKDKFDIKWMINYTYNKY